eukprot:scaffold23796_cov75-Phaeocystis_antarctica.AAC.1
MSSMPSTSVLTSKKALSPIDTSGVASDRSRPVSLVLRKASSWPTIVRQVRDTRVGANARPDTASRSGSESQGARGCGSEQASVFSQTFLVGSCCCGSRLEDAVRRRCLAVVDEAGAAGLEPAQPRALRHECGQPVVGLEEVPLGV